MKVKIYKSAFVCFSLLIALTLAALSFAPVTDFARADGNNRGEITVFSWEDYINEGDEETGDEGVLAAFEEETGIKVNYYTFATNEEMYNELAKDPDAVDLICPSEYMIMKMKDEELIKKFSFTGEQTNYENYVSPYIKNVFESLGLAGDDGYYAVGYMWGTMGLVYDSDVVSAEELSRWASIWDEKFHGRVTIKDSIRDTYIMTLAKVHERELLALDRMAPDYNQRLTAIFNDTEPETISKVEEELLALKNNLYRFEVDSGKDDIVSGKIDVYFAWSGDAVAAISESRADGKNLGYVVPEEGSNVWFDGWVMPKNANEELALEFIDFMCKPESAISNMDYIGYTSCVAGDEVFGYVSENYYEEDGENEVDLKYFFDPTCEDDTFVIRFSETGRELFAQYSDEETIARCAVMDNFSDEVLISLNDMWKKVKLITLSDIAMILICLGIALAVAAAVVFANREKIFGSRVSEKERKIKKGLKVVEKKSLIG